MVVRYVPGWMTALAGADTEVDLLARLHRIRTMTDGDGSFWWWPYRHDAPTAPQPARGNSKCAWAAGVFACLFVNKVIGVEVDIPATQVGLRPFSPWNEFTWKDCRMGSGVFHFSHRRNENGAAAEIENLNSVAYRGVIELILPAGAQVLACSVNGRVTTGFTVGKRYRGIAVRITEAVSAGGRLLVELSYGR